MMWIHFIVKFPFLKKSSLKQPSFHHFPTYPFFLLILFLFLPWIWHLDLLDHFVPSINKLTNHKSCIKEGDAVDDAL